MLFCQACGFGNLDQSAFCGGCGQLLAGPRCPSCHAVNPAVNKFCNQCGSRLPPDPPSSEAADPTPDHSGSLRRRTGSLPSVRRPPLPSVRPVISPAIAGLNAATSATSTTLAKWSTHLLAVGGVVVALAQLGLYFSVDLNEKAPIGYLLLLALGVALFSLGSAGLWAKRKANGATLSGFAAHKVSTGSLTGTFTATIGVLTGALAMGVLLALLVAGSTWGWTLLPWLLALASFAVAFVPRVRLADMLLLRWTRDRAPDLVAVLVLTGLFLGLNIHDLRDWYYSAIGDEFIFFEHARHIVDSGVSRPFSQEGVYNKHPVMNSAFQAAVMWLFGADYFGWTFSELLNAAITIPGIYLLGHALGGRRAAVISAALFSFSHFVFAFSHVGYNNLSALPVAVWSLALFVLGCRNGNPLLLYAAGVIAGLGFYTHYSGRAVMPVIFLFALTAVGPRRLISLWPLAFGFALTVAPTLVVEQDQVFTRMFGQVVGGYSDVVTGDVADRILNNIQINLPAFNYNSTVHTYVYGPLLDPVSAVLAVLGIAFAVGFVRRPLVRLLLIWYAVAAVMTGVLSPYPSVAITRLVFMVPPLVLLAGLLVSEIWQEVAATFPEYLQVARQIIASGSLAMLLSAVLVLNLWQFWYETPKLFPHRPEAVALGAFRSVHCGGDVSGTVFVGQSVGDGSLLTQALTAFDPDGPLPRRLNHGRIVATADLPAPPFGCVVFVNPAAPEARTLQSDLARRYPEGRLLDLSNPSRTTAVTIFVRPHD